MSKKKKGSPGSAVTPLSSRPAVSSSNIPSVAVRPQGAPPLKPADVPESERPFELIRFDKRVRWFIGICVGLFVLLTLAKINYSSIGMWNTVLPDGSLALLWAK